ncbi:VanW family protein [Candidatus Peregrinibacteria bacterium]|nr:VanW family protein [Candidatus Peregrinibacteria bacterium]
MAKKKKKQKYKAKKTAKPAAKKSAAVLENPPLKKRKHKKQSKKQTAKQTQKEKQQKKSFKIQIPSLKLFKKKTEVPQQPTQAAAKIQNQGKTKTESKEQIQAAAQAETQARAKESKLVQLRAIYKILAINLRIPVIIGFSLLGIALIFFAASLLLTLELDNKSMPGTRVAGMDVGLLTVDEIQNKLMQKGTPFIDSKIPINLDNTTLEFAPNELGIGLDARRTLQDIEFIKFGRTSGLEVIQSLISPSEAPYYVSVDLNTAVKNIEFKFNFDEKKSSNAYLAFENNTLTIVPEKSGKAIDLRTLYFDIKQNARELSAEPVNIILVDDNPLVTQTTLEEELSAIKETLNKKTFLEYENFTYTIKLIDHLDWVKFDYKDELKIGDLYTFPIETTAIATASANLQPPFLIEKKLRIHINSNPFEAWVDEKIVPDIESEPQDVEIYKNEKGEIIFNGKGENGRKIIKRFLISALEEAVNNNIEDINIPVAEKKAQVQTSEELQDMGIKTLIATGRSAFAGSPTNRIYNINVGMNRFNGTLIAPGETFSFNEHLGPVDASTGYRPELVIKAEGTIPEYGGGLCQVSSTMYRAALLAGFPIVERAPHSYAVSYYAQIYGYGLDSTIYPGVRDLKFINDTSGYVLVQSYTDGVKAFYKFYGTDDNRKIEMEGPYTYGYHSPGPAIIIESPGMAPGARKQVENAHTGFSATWYRYITKNGETIKERIDSVYKAVPAKIMVGPSASGE